MYDFVIHYKYESDEALFLWSALSRDSKVGQFLLRDGFDVRCVLGLPVQIDPVCSDSKD